MTRAHPLLRLEFLERHPARLIATVCLVFALAYVSALTFVPRSHGRILNGDAIQYYAYLRSLAFDRDLDFTNEYRVLYGASEDGAPSGHAWIDSTTPTGMRTNQMSIGPALLWAPFFLVTWAGLALLRPFGVAVPLDGFAAPFLLSTGVAGVVYAAIGAWFCYRACRALFPEAPAFWGALTAWLASSALYYSVVSPTYSHATSMMTCAAFCDLWLRTRGDHRLKRYVWLGLVAGLAALVRWQDIVILALPGIELLAAAYRGRSAPARCAGAILIMVLAAALMLLPQMLAWRTIYGQLIVMPQGQGFMRWTSPMPLAVLLSLRHGLLTWTPAIALALVGWWWLARRDAVVGWSVVAVFLVTLYVNASVSDWWAGEAFGARRFAGDTVFFALGFAALFACDIWKRRPVALRWTAVALIAFNGLFLLQYQLAVHGFETLAPYPTTVQQVLFDRLTLPWRLLSHLLA